MNAIPVDLRAAQLCPRTQRKIMNRLLEKFSKKIMPKSICNNVIEEYQLKLCTTLDFLRVLVIFIVYSTKGSRSFITISTLKVRPVCQDG